MRRKINFAATLVVAATIIFFSLRPVPYSPGAPGGSMVLLHFLAYFGLAASLILYFHDTTKGHFEAFVVAAAFGAFVEILQIPMTGRYFSLTDIGVNILGASVIFLDHRIDVVSAVIEQEQRCLEKLFGFKERF
jgi:hypothetical protein